MTGKEGEATIWTPRTLVLLIGGGVLLYQAAFHAWYGGSLLGRYPVLDGREILLLAEAIATGQLPAEPFYRAPLYSSVLAPFYGLGISEEGVIWIARLINLLSHLGGAIAIGWLARWFWQDSRAGWAGFALAGFYPVTLHFAGDPLDTVFAWGLFVGSLAILTKALPNGCPKRGWSRYPWLAGAGLLFILAVAARPHYLVTLPVYGLPLLYWTWRERRLPGGEFLALVLPLILGALLLGWTNLRVGGEFRILPWQGPSNWYAANQPGAHGKFFVHSRELPLEDLHQNPTRRESELIFVEETGHPGDWSIAEFNAFWQEKNARLRREETGTLIRQMLTKALYLIHHTEQYNNKTYHFHAQRTPLLRWNPLGWAVLFTLAVAILPLALRQFPLRTGSWMLTFALLAGGIILYFVSARFRLPLATLLMIPAAGWFVQSVHGQLKEGLSRVIPVIGAGLVALFFSLYPWPGVNTPDTTIEDRLLLAQAADQLGEDDLAILYAQDVLSEQPDRLAAWEVKVNARLNQFLLNLWEEKIPATSILSLEEDLPQVRREEIPIVQWTLSLIRWQQGRETEAIDLWTALAEDGFLRGRPELGALLVNDPDHRVKWIEQTETYLSQPEAVPSPYLLAGLALIGNPEGQTRLARTFPPPAVPRLLNLWRNLMTPPPSDS